MRTASPICPAASDNRISSGTKGGVPSASVGAVVQASRLLQRLYPNDSARQDFPAPASPIMHKGNRSSSPSHSLHTFSSVATTWLLPGSFRRSCAEFENHSLAGLVRGGWRDSSIVGW